jgi:predicted nucleotide-binding protein
VPKKPVPAAPERPALVVPLEEAKRLLDQQVSAGEAAPNVSINNNDMARQWYEYTAELLRQIFTTDELTDEFTGKGGYSFGDEDISTGAYLKKLRSIRTRLHLYPVTVPRHENSQVASSNSAGSSKVFLVHGHDDGARETAARFLERLGLEVVILHEQASAGKTIMEKLEAHGDVAFALVLLTPDDLGRSSSATSEPRARARQNVILELGYFFGRLGRHRVCALHKGDVELPSDYLGIVYVNMDPGGAWHLLVGRELRAAGFSIDLNQLA